MKKLFLLCLALSMTSCVDMDHTVVVRNSTSQRVAELTLKTASNNFGFVYGTLIPKSFKGYTGPMKIEKQDACTVNWKDTNGQLHKMDIDLSHEDLAGFNGNLEFILNENGRFTVKTRKE